VEQYSTGNFSKLNELTFLGIKENMLFGSTVYFETAGIERCASGINDVIPFRWVL
jgi:hypothetical protein